MSQRMRISVIKEKYMRNFHKKIACTLTGVMLCGTLMGAVPVLAKDAEKYTNTDFAMDTVVSETLYTTGDDLNAEIGNKLREIESGLLSWTDEDSQISKLNAAAGETTEVSDELAGYLAQIEQLADDSGGAFDPTLGKVIRLWDIDGEDPHVPEQSELEALLKDVGYQNVTLDGNKVTLAEDTTLDLGATGKGIGCDVISEFLKDQKEVEGMILNLGGSSVMAYGQKPDDSPWKVAVTDPRDTEGDYLGAITIKGGEFLSTSGDYEKYSMEDGKRYHHILNPKTGYPVATDLESASIRCESSTTADAYSTILFLLGHDAAVSLVESDDRFEAVFVDDEGSVTKSAGSEFTIL